MDSRTIEPFTQSPDPRAAFAELSKIMLGSQPLSETLTRIAELAKQTIPGVEDASVTLRQNSKVATINFTGPLEAQLDERQYDAGIGPCMDAELSGGPIAIDDTAHSDAYPDFGRVAHRHGITRTMSVGLPVEQRTIGALSLYGRDETTFDATTAELATAFASYAAVAVANADVYASTVTLAGNLQRALDARAVIDQANASWGAITPRPRWPSTSWCGSPMPPTASCATSRRTSSTTSRVVGHGEHRTRRRARSRVSVPAGRRSA